MTSVRSRKWQPAPAPPEALACLQSDEKGR